MTTTADRTVVFTVAVGFNEHAEHLSAMGQGFDCKEPGDLVAQALLAVVSMAMSEDETLDGCFAHLVLHSIHHSEHFQIELTPHTEGTPR